MRVPYLSLLAILGLYVFATAPNLNDLRVPAVAHGVAGVASNLPDQKLTPGAVLGVDIALICKPGYAKLFRQTTRAMKLAVYTAYHLAPDASRYEIDHLIPLELGGADVVANLWPQSYETPRGSAGEKDRLENFLHRQVCAGKMPLRQAQAEIATDWLAAYQKYFGTN
jgi:hypothetical protein